MSPPTDTQPASQKDLETLKGVLPPPPFDGINRRWHGGGRMTAEDVGALLDMVMERHLLARRLATQLPGIGDPIRAEIIRRVAEMSDGSAEHLLDGLRAWALGQGFPAVLRASTPTGEQSNG